MLKRSLIAVALAASALSVSGTAQASAPSAGVSARNTIPSYAEASQCLWRDGCYKCYNYRTGSWEVQYCDDDSG